MPVEEVLEVEPEEEQERPSFIHSYLCGEIMEHLTQNKHFKAFPELTLAIENGLRRILAGYAVTFAMSLKIL